MAANDYVKLWIEDYKLLLEPYSMEERGRIIWAMMDYKGSHIEPEFVGNERFVSRSLKPLTGRRRKASMTPAECREAVRTMFADLYPTCKVIYSYPNAVRPPLPYIVLDFESIDTVGAFETIEDGILQQQKCKRIPFSAELVTESKTTHAAGVKKVGLSTAVDDLDQAVQFFDSQYGWTACTNDIAPIKGRLTQTDAEARTSYTNRVASRGTGTVASIVSLLYSDVDGVTFAAGYENYNDTTDAAGRPPHSIEIVVQGGSDEDVANIIWKNKAGGIRAYGKHYAYATDINGNRQYALDDNDEWRLLYALRSDVADAILKNVEEIKQIVANTSASEQAAARSASAANVSAIAASKSERISTENASSAAASERASRDSALDARAAEGNTLNYMNRTADIANQVAGSAASINFAFGPDVDGRFSFFVRRSS